MNKLILNYITDVLLGIFFFVTFITGLLQWKLLRKLLGLSGIVTTSPILKIHTIFGIIMGLLVLFHIILHWKWIISVTKSLFKR